MPNVSFETKVRSVDLRIEISDISEETANRIREYIQAEIAAASDIFARDVSKTYPLPEIKEDPETEEKTAAGRNELTRRQKTVRGLAAYAPVMKILADAKANPEGYEWRWAAARMFCEEWDAVKAFGNRRLVGAVLSAIGDEGVIRKQDRDAYHRDRTYYLPFPVIAAKPEETAEPETASVSDRIREYRAKGDISIQDLSTKIGYPETVVRAWEAGTSVPSVEGKKELESLFGKHIFDGVQKPVIW